VAAALLGGAGVGGSAQPDPVADPGVDHGGDVAGAGQVPFSDRVSEEPGGVVADEFGGAQGAPEPSRLVESGPGLGRKS
jgi:hypothetical protein